MIDLIITGIIGFAIFTLFIGILFLSVLGFVLMYVLIMDSVTDYKKRRTSLRWLGG